MNITFPVVDESIGRHYKSVSLSSFLFASTIVDSHGRRPLHAPRLRTN
jgi:hypothetical protein